MSKITNKVALDALAIFTAHKNIDKIFMTSDGQGFTDEEKAKDCARYHKDQSITPFERGFEETYQDKNADDSADKTADNSDERQKLVDEHEELFGRKPNHNTGVEKLKAAIDAKKAELAAAKKVEVPVVEVVKKSSEEETVNK